MKNLRQFTVVPFLPERLTRLQDIAYNLWWVWDSEALDLWRRMDLDLWEEIYHNPVKLLGAISQKRLKELAEDDSFLAHLDRVANALDSYLGATTWFDTHYKDRDGRTIGYFSFEYGLAESLPTYSGGLGILSGDHLKSASELGLPLVGIGLLYRQGYFRQYLNSDGWQQEYLPTIDVYTLPVVLQAGADGSPLLVQVEMADRVVQAQIWKVQVGRIPLYLLDANLPVNAPEDREITAQLYGGDNDLRIRQEMLLGIGGYRALRTLGIQPSVCHMNEGHAAFLALERIREAMHTHRLSFEEAKIATTAGNVFTTHTPVPAGNDRFTSDRILHYFGRHQKELGLSAEKFLGFGRENESDASEWYCMTVLALKLSGHSNGVSQLHGEVSRKMWKRLWPEVVPSEIPIDHITNGIHIRTWISGEMAQLFDRYLGIRWWSNPVDTAVWERVSQIPDSELWRTHERRAERLVSFVRRRLRQQLIRRGLPSSEVNIADEVLDPDRLTIGFARRFATYKRATLLFRDPERLARLMNNPERPLQIVFAGKAHPADTQGKQFIRDLAHFCRRPEFRHHMVFLEDYDMNVARYLVQGVDVWLNTPRRPLEASGTSGMKAAANGVLNLSIPDGWWVEGYQGDNGWTIGSGEDYNDIDYQDKVESETLYELLEKDVVPLYYDRGRDDLPRDWIARMKRCMISICPRFNTNRMLFDYSEKFYFPATEQHLHLSEKNFTAARQAAKWLERVQKDWKQVEIVSVHSDCENQVLLVGKKAPVKVEVALHELAPEDVGVEVFFGRLNSAGEVIDGQVRRLEFKRKNGKGDAVFEGALECHHTGRYAFAPRVLINHSDIPAQDRLKNIKWG